MEPSIYLMFKGNCTQAMSFYTQALNGEVLSIFKNSDASPESRMPGGDDMVMHMRIRVGNTIIMASDCPEQMYQAPQGFSISIEPSNIDEFNQAYEALSQQAQQITMAPAETFWADKFAMLTDQYGTPWMLNYPGSKSP